MGRSSKNVNVGFLLLCCAAALGLGIPLFRSNLPPNSPFQRNVQYSFTLQNRTGQVIKDARLFTFAPVRETGTQQLENLSSTHPHDLLTDALGNQVLRFTFDGIPPYAAKVVSIDANLQLLTAARTTPLKDSAPFLRAEPGCESDHPEIRRLAADLKGPTPLQTAKRIFQWVKANVVSSGYTRNARGALYALRNKKGDCTEVMYLFGALCRANGIPTRFLGGYVCPEDSILTPVQYHNWTEFYHENAWRIADPQRGGFMEKPSHYIATKMIGGTEEFAEGFDLFRLVGEGLTARMNG